MGLAGGEPALQVVPSVDAVAPAILPVTGGESSFSNYVLAALALGLAFLVSGLLLRFRQFRITAQS